ncbi:Kunitz trypsin inhibitor 2-like protein [Tanacetum coccineum]
MSISTLSLSSVQSQSLHVLDTDGNLLVNGASYYILPAISYRGGGVKLTPTTLNQTCPLDVSQENNNELDGLPLTFLPAIPNIDGIIRQSRDLNIRFSNRLLYMSVWPHLAGWRMCRPLCGGVGSTIAKTGRRSLILSNEDPLKVKFKKV